MKKPDVCLEEKNKEKNCQGIQKTNLILFDDFSVYSKVEFTLRKF